MVADKAAIPARVQALRSWLNSTVFLDAPPPPPLTAERLAIGLALAIAGVAIILLRLGGLPLDSVWAEDGPIFLSEALNSGVLDALTTNYTGYLHLGPRLLAELAALVPLDWSAEVLAVSGSMVAVLCAFVVWIASAGHLPDPRLRAALAAMVVLLPVVGAETLANVTYVQWLMFFPTFWLLLWRPASRLPAVAGALFIAVTLMSAPLALLLAPIAALRAIAIRDARDIVLVAGFTLGAAVQAVAILSDDTPQTPAGWHADFPSAYLYRVVGGLMFGHPLEAGLWEISGTLVVVAAAIALGALALIALARRVPGRRLSMFAIAFSVGLFLFSAYQRDSFGLLLWPPEDATTRSARYAIVPALFLLTALLVQLQHRSASMSEPTWSRIRLGVIVAISVAALSSFYVGDDRRQPGWSADIERARDVCRQDAPTSVLITTSPSDWMIELDCGNLVE